MNLLLSIQLFEATTGQFVQQYGMAHLFERPPVPHELLEAIYEQLSSLQPGAHHVVVEAYSTPSTLFAHRIFTNRQVLMHMLNAPKKGTT
jgi:hypothetical protein